MTRRIVVLVCLLAFALALPATGAPARRKASSPTRTTAVKQTPATKQATAAKRAAAKRKAAGAKAGPAKATAAEPARTIAGPRRLEDIHIEGEIPAPQVLFVTARDQRRLTKFHHRRYLRSAAEFGAATPLPGHIALTPPATPAAGAP